MLTEQQTKFIELRAKGLSLASISTELDVCKRTLVNWGHKLEAEIQNHYSLEQEALQDNSSACASSDSVARANSLPRSKPNSKSVPSRISPLPVSSPWPNPFADKF